MKIVVFNESNLSEKRIAASPDTVKKFISKGAEFWLEEKAGNASGLPDEAFSSAGAKLFKNKELKKVLKDADVLLTVNRPCKDIWSKLEKPCVIVGMLDPWDNKPELSDIAKKGHVGLSMELLPRISRAQSMDVLSSQANLMGYQAAIEASYIFNRAMPMMMTAAGSVEPAKVFVMGAGVAGLQAIATASRLGAVVTATDVRPAAKEQVASLGAKFIAVEDDEFKSAETAGGYAKQMSEEYMKKQADLVAQHISKQDIVITTALIPGRPAPRLVSDDMIKSMSDGSVVVDMAVNRGGNVEGSVAGEHSHLHGVVVVGASNLIGQVAGSASRLYAKNLFNFISPLIDNNENEDATFNLERDEQLITPVTLFKNGEITN